MAKKSVKKSTKKKTPAKKSASKTQNINKTLIENLVKLQKAETSLALKLDDLSEKLSRFVSLFELSAKTFIEKQGGEITQETKQQDKEMLKKLEELADQNKTIAKALTMMEGKLRTQNPTRIATEPLNNRPRF